MTIRPTYSCNICGTERKEANHWFIAYVTIMGIHIHTWAWTVMENKIDAPNVRHLCGQECVHRMVDEFISCPTSEIKRGGYAENEAETANAASV